jgi:hypothetical protein
MRSILRGALAALTLLVAGQAWAQVTLYADSNFQGAAITVDRAVPDLRGARFNDRASSITVRGGTWQLCDEGEYRGHCVTLGPGQYNQLSDMQLNDRISSLRPVRGDLAYGEQPVYRDRDRDGRHDRRWNNGRWPERGQLILYEDSNFGGRSVRVDRDAATLDFAGFNDRASSIVVNAGRWQVCSDSEFRGNCRVLPPGQYANLAAMGLNDRVSSLRLLGPGRRVERGEYAPLPPGYQGSPPWERD